MAQEFYKETLFARISFILHLSRLISRGNLIQKKKKKKRNYKFSTQRRNMIDENE